MGAVELTFAGSGDAFGSGGRLPACLAVATDGEVVLLDCGPSVLVGLKRCGIDPNAVGTVVVTHLHGDHFAGIPFLVLDGQFHRRDTDLLIVGPPGVQARVEGAMEALYAGSTHVERRFDVRYGELSERVATTVGPATVTAYPVVHPSGAPPFAVRVAIAGRTIAYSGDTEWTDALLEAADGADVFVCECYQWDRDVRYHLSYATLLAHRDALTCRRLVLTHMGDAMLAHAADIADGIETAYDGLRLTL